MRLEQAVILCGGLGTRLRPLTDTMPKPMAPVNGRPFLAYLVQQLREQGITRIMLLTGYRGEMIREYFADGDRFGVSISYSQGPTEWETGRRLWEARAGFDPRFLLLYSDNYAPFSLNKLETFHCERAPAVTLVVQRKANGNIRMAADASVEVYDPTRATPGLDFVEIGYMIVERDAMFDSMADTHASFSFTLRRLSESGRLCGFVSRDPYHSISDPERLRLTERYLENKRLLLIDRDGTINARPPRAEYVTSWERFEWIEPTLEAMRQLATKGFRFIVLSNQAGIARGLLDWDSVNAINSRMREELAALGVEILDVYTCPHHWDDACECRKPEPAMFFRASAEHQVRMNRTMYIGDDPRDYLAAQNAGCIGVLVGPDRHGVDGHPTTPDKAAATLLELVPWIESRFEEWESVP